MTERVYTHAWDRKVQRRRRISGARMTVSVGMAETLKRQVNPRTIVGGEGTRVLPLTVRRLPLRYQAGLFHERILWFTHRFFEILKYARNLQGCLLTPVSTNTGGRSIILTRLPSFLVLPALISSMVIDTASCHSHGALVAQGNCWHTVRTRWICAVLGFSPVLATVDKSLIPDGSLFPLLELTLGFC